jgi:hypothetical protein
MTLATPLPVASVAFFAIISSLVQTPPGGAVEAAPRGFRW